MEKFQQNIDQQEYLKKIRWESTSLEVENITDGLGMKIDAGIRNTVIGLKVNDFNTTASCEGHIDRGLPHPWVDIRSMFNNAENKKSSLEDMNTKKELERKIEIFENSISDLLNDFYSKHQVRESGKELFTLPTPTGFRLQPKEGRLLGRDNWNIYDEWIKTLSLDQRKKNLESYQEEMSAFAQFLEERFFQARNS